MRLSVLIPVYNERNTIETILDRVHATPVRKEIICVDDCSTDGTRERLVGAARGGLHRPPDPPAAERRKGHARSAPRSPRAPATSSSCRTPTSSTTRRTGPRCSSRSSTARPTPASAPASSAVRTACCTTGTRSATRCSRTFSNMLTNLNLTDMETCYKAVRGDLARSPAPHVGPVRLRAGDHRAARAARRPHLRGAHLLRRPHLRRRQEDQLARRRRRVLAHPEVQPRRDDASRTALAAVRHGRPARTRRDASRASDTISPTTTATSILDNPRVHELRGILRALRPRRTGRRSYGGDGYRPLVMTLFTAAVGRGRRRAVGVPPRQHRCSRSPPRSPSYWCARAFLPVAGAWVAAALFAVHPVHVEVTGNVVGQSELHRRALPLARRRRLHPRAAARGMLALARRAAVIARCSCSALLAKEHADRAAGAARRRRVHGASPTAAGEPTRMPRAAPGSSASRFALVAALYLYVAVGRAGQPRRLRPLLRLPLPGLGALGPHRDDDDGDPAHRAAPRLPDPPERRLFAERRDDRRRIRRWRELPGIVICVGVRGARAACSAAARPRRASGSLWLIIATCRSAT